MRKHELLRFTLSGAAAGIVNGMFGSGGGMVLVPLLIKLANLDDKKAFSTSLCIIFPLCFVSVLVHSARGSLLFNDAWPYLIGGLAGGLIGAFVFKKVTAKFLHRLFGMLILWGGVRLLR